LAGKPELAYERIPYPPHMLLVFVLLSMLPLTPAFLIWNVVSASLFSWAARPYMRGLPATLAVLTPAGCVSLIFGQTGLLIGALWLMAFRGYPWAVGLLTLKPHIGWISALTLNSSKKFLIACASATALLLLTAVFFPSTFTAFPEALHRQAALIGSKRYGIWYLQVVSPSFAYGTLGWVIFGGAAAFLLSKRFNVFTAATASMLIAPYAIHYDMTVACLGMILALSGERRPVFQFLLIFGFVTPYLIMWGSTWFAPPLILGALYAQVFAEQEPKSEKPD
jgi:hypothetical protein